MGAERTVLKASKIVLAILDMIFTINPPPDLITNIGESLEKETENLARLLDTVLI